MARYERACKHCKQKGHGARECEFAPVRVRVIIPPLTESQFQHVREMHRHGIWTSEEVADELKLPLKEVNAAFAYSLYYVYLAYRRAKTLV